MKYLLPILLLLTACKSEPKKYSIPQLKDELDSVFYLDQWVRKTSRHIDDSTVKDSLAHAWHIPPELVAQYHDSLWGAIDSTNLIFIEDVIKRFGYPGKTLVGDGGVDYRKTKHAAWYVIQHSDKIDKYLPMIKEAGKSGDIDMDLVAMMEDRHLMEQGKEQIYGTQGICLPLKDNDTPECFIWPIKDAGQVNERRRKAGIFGTVEEYCKGLMGTEYKEVKLSDIKHNPYTQSE